MCLQELSSSFVYVSTGVQCLCVYRGAVPPLFVCLQGCSNSFVYVFTGVQYHQVLDLTHLAHQTWTEEATGQGEQSTVCLMDLRLKVMAFVAEEMPTHILIHMKPIAQRKLWPMQWVILYSNYVFN